MKIMSEALFVYIYVHDHFVSNLQIYIIILLYILVNISHIILQEMSDKVMEEKERLSFNSSWSRTGSRVTSRAPSPRTHSRSKFLQKMFSAREKWMVWYVLCVTTIYYIIRINEIAFICWYLCTCLWFKYDECTHNYVVVILIET